MKDRLLEIGFKPNRHGDAYDRGDYRVYFDDSMVHVVKFADTASQVIEWDSAIDGNMGDDKAMMVIEAMTA